MEKGGQASIYLYSCTRKVIVQRELYQGPLERANYRNLEAFLELSKRIT